MQPSTPVDAGARGHPDVQRAGQPAAHRRRVRAACPTRRRSCVDDGSPGRHRRDRRRARRRRPAGARAAPRRARQGLGAAYLAGFAGRAGRGYDVVVEMDADGSHQPEQLPAPARPRWRDADLVIGVAWVPGGAVRQLAAAPQGALARRQPLRPAAARHPAARRDRRLPRLPRERAARRSTCDASRRRATASRSTWPGARCGPGSGSSRCRSRSSSASRRRVEDEPDDRRRGAAADHRVGPAAPAAISCVLSSRRRPRARRR